MLIDGKEELQFYQSTNIKAWFDKKFPCNAKKFAQIQNGQVEEKSVNSLIDIQKSITREDDSPQEYKSYFEKRDKVKTIVDH